MKRIYLVMMVLFLNEIAVSQPQFHNLHVGGFQRTKFTMDNQGATGSAKFGNISFAGLAINDKAAFHIDMSYLVNALVGFDNMQGGVFEFGAGLPFASKENSRWAWSFDVMFRKSRTEKFKYDSLLSPEFKEVNFAGIGGSIYYVRTFADFIYISPKLSISYGGVNIAGIENRRDFMTDAAISIGCPLAGGWGISSTFGIYGSNWENDNETRTEFTMGYIRVGLAYLWKN